MKLKQALVLGLTTAVLAIPAFAADDATSQSASVTPDQKAALITPAKKEAFHKKGQKEDLVTENSEAEKMDKQTDLNKLDTVVNPGEKAAK